MGTGGTKHDLEGQILIKLLEREQIRKERNMILDEIKIETGEDLYHEPIPDFIDIEYYKDKKRKLIEKQIKKYEEEERKKMEAKRRRFEEKEEERRKEEEAYNNEFLYQPLKFKFKKRDSDKDNIYSINYVLPKRRKSLEIKKDKNKEKNKKDKNDKKDKKGKKKEKEEKESQNEEK